MNAAKHLQSQVGLHYTVFARKLDGKLAISAAALPVGPRTLAEARELGFLKSGCRT